MDRQSGKGVVVRGCSLTSEKQELKACRCCKKCSPSPCTIRYSAAPTPGTCRAALTAHQEPLTLQRCGLNMDSKDCSVQLQGRSAALALMLNLPVLQHLLQHYATQPLT